MRNIPYSNQQKNLYTQVQPNSKRRRVQETKQVDEQDSQDDCSMDFYNNKQINKIQNFNLQTIQDESIQNSQVSQDIQLQVDFKEILEVHFDGLKVLTNNFTDGCKLDISGLADLLIQQNEVGLVAQSDEDTPFAVISIINLQKNIQKQAVKDILKYLNGKCNPAQLEDFRAVTSSEQVGLIINERAFNCPPSISTHLFGSLLEDIQECKKGENQQLQDLYSFKKVIVSCLVFLNADTYFSNISNKRKRAGKNKKKKNKNTHKVVNQSQLSKEDIMFLKPEDQLLYEVCDLSFTFQVKNRPIGQNDAVPLRLVMIIDFSKLHKISQQIPSVVDQYMD